MSLFRLYIFYTQYLISYEMSNDYTYMRLTHWNHRDISRWEIELQKDIYCIKYKTLYVPYKKIISLSFTEHFNIKTHILTSIHQNTHICILSFLYHWHCPTDFLKALMESYCFLYIFIFYKWPLILIYHIYIF